MTAEHARPLLAYLCVALAAALVLVQGVTLPRTANPLAILGAAAESAQTVARLGFSEADVVQFRQAPRAATVGPAAGRRPPPARTTLEPARTVAQRPTGRSGPGRPAASAPQRPTPTRSTAPAVRPGKGQGKARGLNRGQASQPRATHRTSPRTSTRTALGRATTKVRGKKR